MTEPSGIENRWILFDTVPTIVDEIFEDGRTYAADALALANAVIEDLRQVGKTLNTIDTTTSITYITPPDAGDFTKSIPSSPNTDFIGPTAPLPGYTDIIKPTPPSSGSTDFNKPTAPADTDDLQYVLRSKLINDISNGTSAISESVETAIFERETERALLIHQDNLNNISAEWAKRGFTLSNAILGSLLSQSEIDYANKRLDVSRDIAIKNFELSDSNTKFAVQQGNVYIGNKITLYKIEVDAEIGRIESIIKKFLADIESYKTEGNLESARVDSIIKKFLADIEAYKTEGNIEDARVSSVIKKFLGDIEVYKAEGNIEIATVDSVIKKYLGDIEKLKTEGNLEAARVDSIIKKFLADIEAYKVSAQTFTSLADINIKEFEGALKQETIKAELLIKNVEIDIKNFEVENNLKIEADRAIGSINSQVVAGALSSVSASVNMGATDSGDYNFSSDPSY